MPEMDLLECLFCQTKHPLDLFDPFCPDCGEPMLLSSPCRGRKFAPHKNLAPEKYLDFLRLSQINPRLSLGEDNTALVPLPRLMQRYRFPRVIAKIETMNPTGSFKDKGTCVAVQKASAAGVKKNRHGFHGKYGGLNGSLRR
jgi:threonine synthase